ncbi:hypothetical protein B0I35DRAFT_370280 [Stachybotrys elegans]|uniref:FAD-binding domain-containing protein n=1 Tax=Stachybotrys elegans TaxID=80388 RepID=A0A8K0T390_9HYPO|nr:hypothetical protein B0I35DRAFT_370280 [Stachybotrys elegans]
MSSHSSTFKVLIAGGGIAALTLANILESCGIDYLLLESHDAIAPPAGASIGLFSNGLRILDQLGCYEPLLKHVSSQATLYLQDKHGNQMIKIPGGLHHYRARHGYAAQFMDRQWVLQCLYDNLQYKDRILLKRKITRVNHLEKGVQVITENGEQFHGSILAGLDGVHSTVRREMFRIGNEAQPGTFDPKELDLLPCDYLCLYGIAMNVPGWTDGEVYTVTGEGCSKVVVFAPNNRTYFFYFKRLPQRIHDKDLTKITKEMEEEWAKKHFDDHITPDLTFGQVYSCRISSMLTPVHEYVLKKWFFGRIITLGDAAHKTSPKGGQGANGTIESVAEFANCLLSNRPPSGDLGELKTADFDRIFRQVQQKRHDRARYLVKDGQDRQALASFRYPLMSTIAFNIIPHAGEEAQLLSQSLPFANGPSLHHLPLVPRVKAVPFDDELPAKPLTNTLFTRVVYCAIMIFLMNVALQRQDFYTLVPPPAWMEWTSIDAQSIGNFTKFLTARSTQKTTGLLMVLYYMSQLISPTLIYTIEGHRSGNWPTPLALPTLFLGLMGWKGIAFAAPLYNICSMLMGYSVPTGRFIEPAAAKALIPALILTYVIPGFLWLQLLSPNKPPFITSMLLYVAPVVAAAWVTAARFFSWLRTPRTGRDKPRFDRYMGGDSPTIQSAYRFAFAIQATIHLAILLYSYQRGIFPLDILHQASFDARFSSKVMKSLATSGLNYDLLLGTGSWFLGNMYSIWELRRHGYITDRTVIRMAIRLLAGQLLVGPGATWTALCYWRERVLLNLSKQGEMSLVQSKEAAARRKHIL